MIKKLPAITYHKSLPTREERGDFCFYLCKEMNMMFHIDNTEKMWNAPKDVVDRAIKAFEEAKKK